MSNSAVLANGHRVHDERVPFPMPGGIAGERRIVEHFLRRLAAVQKNPAIHVVQLAVDGDLVFRVLDFHAVGHRTSCWACRPERHLTLGSNSGDPAMRDFRMTSHLARYSGVSFGASVWPALTSVEHQHRSRRRHGPASLPRRRRHGAGGARCGASACIAKRIERGVHTGEVRRGLLLRAKRCRRSRAAGTGAPRQARAMVFDMMSS